MKIRKTALYIILLIITVTSAAPVSAEEFTYPRCASALAVCAEDNSVLYSFSEQKTVAPASLTKLLTASVALKYVPSDTVIRVGSEQNLVKPNSSVCWIQPGHRLKLYDLLTGMLMASGNDAAYTVAAATARYVYQGENLSDTEAVRRFVGLMNSTAADVGMKNSRFANPEGWDDPNQYTTATDLMKLAMHAYSIPEIRSITGTYSKYVVFASGENINWTNRNLLLDPYSAYYCPEAVGMKTGTTSGAGNCLISAFRANSKTYFCVVTGCETNGDRYELTRKIFSYCSGGNAYPLRTWTGRVYGDVNGDGFVRADDARLALRRSADVITLLPEAFAAADLNGDGIVRAAEARTILRISAGMG